MNKIFIILFLLVSLVSYGQFPNNVGEGNGKMQTYDKGARGVDSGFVLRSSFADTTAANAGFLDGIPGIIIRVGSQIWYRNAAATQWILLNSSAATTNIYNSDGTISDAVRTVTISGSNELTFKRSGVDQLFLRSIVSGISSPDNTNRLLLYNDSTVLEGLARSSGSRNVALTMDSVTGRMYWGNAGVQQGLQDVITYNNVLSKTDTIKSNLFNLYFDSTDIIVHERYETNGGDYYTQLFGNKIEFTHSGAYTPGSGTAGLNSMNFRWFQNDTLLHTMGVHNGPLDKHFYLAHLTSVIDAPGIPANRLMTVEYNDGLTDGTYMSWYLNPTNDNPQVLIGTGVTWAAVSGYQNYRFVNGETSLFSDTARFTDVVRMDGLPTAAGATVLMADGSGYLSKTTMDTTLISNFYSKVRSLFSSGNGTTYNSTIGRYDLGGTMSSNIVFSGSSNRKVRISDVTSGTQSTFEVVGNVDNILGSPLFVVNVGRPATVPAYNPLGTFQASAMIAGDISMIRIGREFNTNEMAMIGFEFQSGASTSNTFIRDIGGVNQARWYQNGKARFDAYGDGTFTGTLTRLAGWDVDGNFVEVDTTGWWPSSDTFVIKIVKRTSFDSLAWAKTADSLWIKAIQISLNGTPITATVTDSTVAYNINAAETNIYTDDGTIGEARVVAISAGSSIRWDLGDATSFFMIRTGSDTTLYGSGADFRLPSITSGASTDSVLVYTASTGRVHYRNASAFAGGGASWNGITDPTGDQALTFDAGESSTWTNSNTTEDLFTVNSSTVTTSSFFSYNRTSTALAAGNNIMELVSSGANGSSSITSTALRISNTNTGTSSTNEGINVTASGASTNNAINATGTITIASGNLNLPSSSTNGLSFGGTVRMYDDGSKIRISASAGTVQFFTSGSNATIQMYNSAGDSYFSFTPLSGTGSAIESLGSATNIKTQKTSANTFSVGDFAGAAKFNVLSTTEQTRILYDASNYFSTTISSTGSATLNLVGTSPTFTFSDAVFITTVANTTTAAVSVDGTQTLTNKRWTARVGSTTSSATPTINTDNVDIYKLTAQTVDITSFTTNLSGTPADGDVLQIQVTGTASRAITWGSSFVSGSTTLPTTTSGTTTLTTQFEYFTTSSYGNNKWVCVNSF